MTEPGDVLLGREEIERAFTALGERLARRAVEARKVADDLGLPYWWLNEQASVYISGKEDANGRRVFDHPGLRVMAASPAHVFAMKARAARTRDIDDLRLLADIIGVKSAEAALQITVDFYPDEPVSPRSAAVLHELFD